MSSADSAERKLRLAEHFGGISSTYDGLRFLSLAARRFVELANLSPGMSVLDVATGTGIVPLLSAEKVGADGRIIGIDISPRMIEVAKQKQSPTSNLQFQTGDAENLDFPDGSFDAVLCASSVFFIPDMTKALKEARRVLKPEGFAMFNTFAPNFLQPLRRMWNERLQKHDIKLGSLPIRRLPDEAACEALLREAGFTRVEVKTERLGYSHPAPESRWAEIEAGLEGAPLKKMSAEEREQIRAEHLAELQALMTPQGIFADVPVIFAFGR